MISSNNYHEPKQPTRAHERSNIKNIAKFQRTYSEWHFAVLILWRVVTYVNITYCNMTFQQEIPCPRGPKCANWDGRSRISSLWCSRNVRYSRSWPLRLRRTSIWASCRTRDRATGHVVSRRRRVTVGQTVLSKKTW